MIDLKTIKRGIELIDASERQRASRVVLIILLSALAAACMVGSILPFFNALTNPEYIHEQRTLAWLYETLGFSSDYAFLVFLGVSSIGIILTGNMLQLLRLHTTMMFTRMLVSRISSRLLRRYLAQPYVFFLNMNSNTASAHILSSTVQAVNTFFYPLVDMLASLVTSLAIIGVLIWVEPTISIVSMVVVGGSYALVLFLLRNRLAHLGKQITENNKKRFRAVNEALVGIKDIKILGRERAYLELYEKSADIFARSQAQNSVLSNFPQFIIQILAFGGIIVLCLFMLHTRENEGGAVSFFPLLGFYAFAIQKLIPELQKIYSALANLRSSVAVIGELHSEFSGTPDTSLTTEDIPTMGLRQKLTFENLGFSYPGAERLGLVDIDVEISAGMSVGIVGRSGAGKTTLADILLGLLEPTKGSILVDGQPLTSETLPFWRRTIGYVPQAIFMSDTSLKQNIALGVTPEKIDEDRVIRVAEAAQLHEFVATLPEGYDTRVGDHGVMLSGGQKQRIGIARALYHDAEVMVFDEATSALDNVTERDLMAAISRLSGDKTVFVIAHRLSTVQNCDKIMVLEHGNLVGFGAWEELARSNRYFQQIAALDNAA